MLNCDADKNLLNRKSCHPAFSYKGKGEARKTGLIELQIENALDLIILEIR